mmetsp:Transcript_6359/g.10423  ORF Transcript_6359/g.10423 Transcript_6359/m.10423 type:complete len:1182 (-) Transcript_6359:159-3704(-)
MGASTSRSSVSVASRPSLGSRGTPSANDSHENQLSTGQQEENEYPHLGSVHVSLSWLNPNALRSNDTDNSFVVTAKGGIFYGNSAPSPVVMSELGEVSMEPSEYPLLDSRAHQLLIAYDNGWNAISSPEVFSRHTGTCLIIGDRTDQGRGHEIKLGDCFRLGSVGVVVSEIKRPGEKEERLDTKRLQYLREEALNFEHDGDEAVLAAKEENGVLKQANGGGDDCEHDEDVVSPTARDNISGNLFCYMCYESHDTPEDHLVAPCACKGDTRYLHVQCLQKWYQSSLAGWRSLVIRTTGSGAPACKICGMAYKTTLTNLDGVKTNLLEADHPGPYMSLVVVTRHDTSPELFNTKFRLNFGPGYRIGSTEEVEQDPELNPSELTIGRSSMCNMVLDYRTVSTVHAKLCFRDGAFLLQDARSSNGTMLYLQGPLKLPQNQSVRLRMGRSTLAIEARRSLTASIRTVFAKQKLPPCKSSLDELQRIMALAPSMLSKSARAQEKEQLRTSLLRNFRGAHEAVGEGGAGGGVESRDARRRSRSNSPRRNDSTTGGGDENNTSHARHRLASNSVTGSPRLVVTEEMLRDIFRHHQSQLPQGTLTPPVAITTGPDSSSTSRGPAGTTAVSTGVDIDSALILGDRPVSQQGSARASPPNTSLGLNVEPTGGTGGSGGDVEGGVNQSEVDTAAVVIPPTALVYNHGLSSGSPTPSPNAQARVRDVSSVNNLAAMTNATLTSRDADGNPLVNQTEFLLQLDHQLQTIETCVQEASTAAMSTVGSYASAEDREREHAEMRVQRAIISQSIQQDSRSGRSVVDNESILLAATVIATKASAIAALTTGKESRKAEKVARRYSIIADKANEMIIKKAIRQSANNTCSARSRVPPGSESLMYYDEEEEVVFRESFVLPEETDDQDDNEGPGAMFGGRSVRAGMSGNHDTKQEKEQQEDGDAKKSGDCEEKQDEWAAGGGRPVVNRMVTFHDYEEENEKEKASANEEPADKQDQEPLSEEEALRQVQALSVLKEISNNDAQDREQLEQKLLGLDFGVAEDSAQSKEQQEVAMAVLMQAAQAAAVTGGGEVVKVTEEDVDEVVQAIREICERRRAAAALSTVDQKADEQEQQEQQEQEQQEAVGGVVGHVHKQLEVMHAEICPPGEDSLLVHEEQSTASVLKEEASNVVPDMSVSEVVSS